MTEHTSGPWWWDNGRLWGHDTGGARYLVLDIDEVGGTGTLPHEPDANLITAAPDLLAAARMVVDYALSIGAGDDSDIRALERAVRKVTGVSA